MRRHKMKTTNEKNRQLLESLKGGLIVSCQVQKDDPIYSEDITVLMAKGAQWAGAVAIRSEHPDQIRQIKAEIDLPIIGLYKIWKEGSDVFVTPTIEAVREVMDAGADIVALDCTFQKSHDGNVASELIKQVKKEYPDSIIFADISTYEEAKEAIKNGADIVAPTLYGYTPETQHIEGANYREFARMCRDFKDEAYVMMEGHIYTPEDAMKCLFLGAHSVVVGSAITRPHLIAKRFVDLMGGYQDNWRDAEKARH